MIEHLPTAAMLLYALLIAASPTAVCAVVGFVAVAVVTLAVDVWGRHAR